MCHSHSCPRKINIMVPFTRSTILKPFLSVLQPKEMFSCLSQAKLTSFNPETFNVDLITDGCTTRDYILNKMKQLSVTVSYSLLL